MTPKIQSFLIALLGIALMVSISATYILGWIVVAWWLAMPLANRSWKKWEFSPLDWPLFLFGAWNVAVVFITGSTKPANAFSYFTQFLLFYWVVHGLDEKEVKNLTKWICVGAAVVGFWGVLQFVLNINYLPNENIYNAPKAYRIWDWNRTLLHYMAVRNERAVGPRSHPLTYAECLVPAFFILLSAALASGAELRKKKHRWIALVFVGLGVLFSQSRAVWIGLVVAGVFYLITLKKWRLLLLGSLCFAIALPAAFWVSPKFKQRVSSIFSQDSGRIADQQSKSTRMELWRASLESIRQHPIIGVGLKGARLEAIDPVTKKLRTWTESHNNFLQVAVESGLIGLGLFIWIWIVFIKTVSNLDPPLRAPYGAILICLFLAGLTESWLRDKEVALLFWVIVAATEKFRKCERDPFNEA